MKETCKKEFMLPVPNPSNYVRVTCDPQSRVGVLKGFEISYPDPDPPYPYPPTPGVSPTLDDH